MSKKYDKDYYENGTTLGISGYKNYHWMPELTLPMVHEFITQLGIKKEDRIIDFGCAKGYVVKAFRLYHHEAFGVDLSDYALSQADTNTKEFLRASLDALITDFPSCTNADWIIAKDVLEHIAYSELPNLLKKIKSVAKNLFVVVPLGNGKKYNIEDYEYDTTHIIREDLNWWSALFNEAGFKIKKASHKMPHIKENWQHYHDGNGFFILVNGD